jgi:two-component system alkaline phosphatase synthesis response regulator PhoP
MSKRILLCDDEVHILRAAEFKFKRAGYDVVLASDGEDGWTEIKKQLPDIVVTDCQMPRLNGLGLAERIKNDPATCHLPVIMLSGKGFELSEKEIQEKYGIRALIGKPFSPRDLFQQVEVLLGGGEVVATPSDAASKWL